MPQWTRRQFVTTTGLTVCTLASAVHAQTKNRTEIEIDSIEALKTMQKTLPFTKELMKRAVGLLIMPKVIKGGLFYGGYYGEGALLVQKVFTAYYTVAGASFGLQVGIQQYSSVLFFMNTSRLRQFRERNGWTLGANFNATLIEVSSTGKIDTNTYTDDVYIIVFGNKGLHAGISISGSKYTQIYPN